MYNKLKYWLTVLYQNAKKEYSERPIATTGVLVAVIGGLLPLLLSESLRSFVFYLLSRTLQPRIELSLFPLILAIVALVAVALMPSKRESQKKNYYFIEYDAFTWKVTTTSMGPNVDSSPYCKIHQVKMLYTSNDAYVCPVCGSENSIELTHHRRNLLHEAVENLAEAKANGHINV